MHIFSKIHCCLRKRREVETAQIKFCYADFRKNRQNRRDKGCRLVLLVLLVVVIVASTTIMFHRVKTRQQERRKITEISNLQETGAEKTDKILSSSRKNHLISENFFV